MLRGTALFLLLSAGTAVTVRADELSGATPFQRQVNAEIDAIKSTGTAPSSACLTALEDMHTAEQQLVDLTGQSSNAPSGSALAENEQGEVAVARDVLASDLETAATSCRPDSVQACGSAAAAKAAKSCAVLSRLPH